MHEASLMIGLLRQIEAVAREQGARRVTGVRVRLGALAHLSPDHFRHHFQQASRGAVSEGARLDITESQDLSDPAAQDILLESVELEIEDPP
jgi:hydrogenase nickel incorporation protein HypA/HybF